MGQGYRMGAKEEQGQNDLLLPYSYGQFWDPTVCSVPGAMTPRFLRLLPSEI